MVLATVRGVTCVDVQGLATIESVPADLEAS
jgi:hypothetical protein